ncbi:MAG: hypothetical protein D6731_06425 [Planctomycetota bacterium]|nr:MAG: hypothetical protein D6731_06425 [Planctomycetota bacterium]
MPELPPTRVVPLDLEGVRTYSIREREHLVSRERFARPVEPDASAGELLDSLPGFLAADRLRELAEAIATARAAGRRVLFGLGGHVVKVGLGPLLADMIERGLVTDLALNGSAAIHDTEVALIGKTSEKVTETIVDGRFGMVGETAEVFARVFARGAQDERGLGRALAEELAGGDYPHRDQSLVLRATELGAEVTVHVALGTDTVHAVPGADGAAIGAATHIDFRRLAAVIADLTGGVYVNVGSAVVLPEVFLKCVAVARNLGHEVSGVTAANLDMLQHYRPTRNVLDRPVERGIALTGHHEIMLPLLRLEALRRLARRGGPR